MTVWITGANGFIARHLARELNDRKVTVDGVGHGLHRDEQDQQWGYRTCLSGTINYSNLDALAAQAELPSIVYHLAGGSSVAASIAQPNEDLTRTVAGTEQLLDWMRINVPECRLVAISSAAVYGSDHAGAIMETAELKPMSPYGLHKLMMERLCQRYVDASGAQAIVVRLFSVYGSILRKQLLWDICCRLRDGHETLLLGGTGREMRDWTHVHDVARLLADVSDYEVMQPFDVLNGASGSGRSVAEIAGLLVKSWGSEAGINFSGQIRAGDPESLLADTRKLSAFGFNWTKKLDVGINEYVQWFKSQMD